MNYIIFEEWLHEVIIEFQKYHTKYEINEIYDMIDLRDAKFQYLDNVQPRDFQLNN